MAHPLIMALFDGPSAAAAAARALRGLGIPQDRVSIVARSHDEEGALARATGTSPGSELEDSRTAGRLGELGAHLLAAIAIVVPGIGPIVADGPLAAGLGEAAGHLGGGVARALERAGVAGDRADRWERAIEDGAILVGAHVSASEGPGAADVLTRAGASDIAEGSWP